VVSNSVFSYFMNKDKFTKTNSLSIWNSLFESLNNMIQDHRVSIRTQLVTKEPSLPIIISLIPFFFGLNEYLQTEYYPIQRKYFFNKNLPGVTSPSEKIDWETFSILKSKNLDFSTTYWKNNNLLIKSEDKDRRLLTSTYNFKASVFNEKENSISPIFYNRIDSNSLNQDILPFKIQSRNTLADLNKLGSIPIHKQQNKILLPNPVINFEEKDKNINTTHIVGIKPLFSNLLDNSTLLSNKKYQSAFNSEFIKFIETFSESSLNPIHLIPNRTMSGYLYPDQYLFQKLDSNSDLKNKVIELQLPFSFLVKNVVNTEALKPPKFLIKTNILNIDENPQFQFTYSGPSPIIDTETGFDWKFETVDQQIGIRNWLVNILGNTNHHLVSPKNFFGIFESPENQKQVFKPRSNKSQTEYWLQNLPIFQSGSFIQPLISNIQSKDIVQFPYLSQKEVLKHTKLNLPLPVLQSNYPLNSIKITNTQFDFNPGFLNTYLKMNTSQYSTTSFVNDYESDYLTSGEYRSLPSIFNTQKNVLFTSLWEPLTFKSWLITAQVGFAFLVFQVLRALADNYGRELLVYLLDLVALLGFVDEELKQEIEILMGQKEKGFRIIQKTNKNFNNIGGIKNLIPEIIEIVWFLRNSGRDFSLSKIIPRGILLTGPPGTGKTLLVQAIAGEAEVPVIALSGSSLLEPGESGALKLELVFQEARQLAPCIVFIDEIDTLAEKREQVLQNPMGADEILESLSTKQQIEIKTENSGSDSGQQEMYKEKLRILMQFLVELDGVQGRNGVVVIGATNRPETLDPAVLRPGRFDRVLELGLPNAEKRGEIFNLYSQNLGTDQTINWDYFIGRTIGYSAADIASIMNQSTLAAVLNSTNHTIETIEFGIDRTTTIGFEKPISASKDSLEIIQLAYYQVGKLLISLLLSEHPDILVTYLWPRRLNIRALQINKNLQTYFFQFAHRSQLEERLIGCYAGKAAEVLFLENYSAEINLSDLGIEDIEFAQNLISLMIDHWYLYSKTIGLQNNVKLLNNFNEKEYFSQTNKMDLLNNFATNTEKSLSSEVVEFTNTFNVRETESLTQQQSQSFLPSSIWQAQVATEFEFSTRVFSDWYRIYLPDPQQVERNLEWIPPDEYYQTNSFFVDNEFNWNNELENSKEYLTTSLMLQSYNQAIKLLDNNRESLDLLVCKLLKDEIIRTPDLDFLFKELKSNSIKKSTNNKVVSNDWGENSRRPIGKKV
jgi:ATP-dependent Zn protease